MQKANRALKVTIGGVERFAAIEDRPGSVTQSGFRCPWVCLWRSLSLLTILWATSFRGTPAPMDPFTAAEAAARLGLGVAVVNTALKRLADDGRVVEGEFRPTLSRSSPRKTPTQNS